MAHIRSLTEVKAARLTARELGHTKYGYTLKWKIAKRSTTVLKLQAASDAQMLTVTSSLFRRKPSNNLQTVLNLPKQGA